MNENSFGLNENVSKAFQHHKLFLWALSWLVVSQHPKILIPEFCILEFFYVQLLHFNHTFLAVPSA